MHAHILQHVPFEDEGSMATWLKARKAHVTRTRFFEDPHSIPAPADVDLLIAMGGPMSVNDENEYPWLAAEKRLVRESIEAGAAVVGICLGAQLMAAAMGARVYPGPEKEIGWGDVQGVATPPGCLRFPDELRVMHWHGETFDLPDEAIRLAGSAVVPNQAFQLGARSVGLQFHLETTPETVRRLIANCRHELVGGPHVATEAELLAEPPQSYACINAVMGQLLESLIAGKSG